MFKQGLAIKEIIWPDGSNLESRNVEQMHIEMEEDLPWVKVTRTNGKVSMHNAIHLDTIIVA